MDYEPLDLDAVLRTIGRGVVFYAPQWDGTTDLELTALGDTEGDISIAFNESFVSLTTPELTGTAKRKSYVEGADPVVTIPIYIADPLLRAIISPTGTASAGFQRRRPVAEYTLAIFPEELLLDVSSNAYETLTFDPTDDTWKVGGSTLTAAQIALLGQSVFLWRGYFASPPIVLKHGEAGKAVESVTFQCMVDTTKPDGHQLLTVGDPTEADIDLAPVSS